MWYTRPHETTHFCPRTDERGTASAQRRVTFLRCLCPSSQPNPVGFSTWGNGSPHCESSLLRRTNGSPCHPHVQPGGTFRSTSRIEPSPPSPNCSARRRDRRDVQNGVTSPTARFWLPDQLVDARLACQAVCLPGVDGTGGVHRDHAPNAQPLGDQLEAGQALDHEPRSVVRGKKPLATDC